MNAVKFELTTSGQLVEVKETRSVIVNADQMFGVLKEQINQPEELQVDAQIGDLRTYYNLGDGVCAFQREFGGTMKTFGGVMLQRIPFYTRWALKEIDNEHVLIPNDGREEIVDVGAPIMYEVPEDLIVHFFVEWHHTSPINIINPNADIVWNIPDLLQSGTVHNCYLTAFSRSRNTCVRLPLPNLYGDAHLCTGTSFSNDDFRQKLNHWGFTTSVKTYARSWCNSAFNLDLLGSRGGRLMNQYRRFIRFDANTAKPMPFSGCADWTISTSPVPLEDVYRPWMSNERPTMPVFVPGEEHMSEAEEPDLGDDEPAIDAHAAFAGQPVPARGARDGD